MSHELESITASTLNLTSTLNKHQNKIIRKTGTLLHWLWCIYLLSFFNVDKIFSNSFNIKLIVL